MNCMGSFQAANTRAGSASKVWTRLSVRSSRETLAGMALLPGRRRGAPEIGLELVELLLPEAAVFLDPVGGGAQPFTAQFAAPPLRLGVPLDQAGGGQHLE